MDNYLIGIDIGTSSVKTILCDAKRNKIVSSASAEHELFSPQPGYSEENPHDWWNGTKNTLKNVFDNLETKNFEISGIGITGMLPAFVLLDKGGEVLRPSIQQNDARFSNEIEMIKKKINPETYYKICGSSLNQQMISPKILWMQNNEPDIYEKTARILGSYDYINYKLTNVFSIESNWALESGLYAIVEENWSNTIFDVLGIQKTLLPQINSPSTIIGCVSSEAAKEIGFEFLKGVPVIAGVADMISSAFISGIKNPGDVLIKLGSAGDITTVSEKIIIDKRLFLDYHPVPGKYCLSGCMASSGSLLRWYKEQFFLKSRYSYKDLDKKIKDIEAGSRGIVLLPYFLGEKTPIFDQKARGVIFGLTISHNKFDLYRSILESIGYGFLHHLDVFTEIGLDTNNLIASDAGASSEIWVQILSNIFGEKISTLDINPGSSLGAAFIAGMACGHYNNWEQIDRFVKAFKTFYPNINDHYKYQKYYKIYRKLYENLKENFIELFEITNKSFS